MAINKLWESDIYYKKANEASSAFDYPGMKVLKRYSKNCKKILDLGCGDGTRLNFLSNARNQCVGVDISNKAISLAKKKYPKCEFKISNLEKLSFDNNSFDLIYSAFVLEHLENPEKVILEAIRVLKKNGILVLMAPNYGAQNRISPSANYSRIKKLFSISFVSATSLGWRKVTPKIINDPKDYQVDCDTTVEPYLGNLIKFLEKNNFVILEKTSLWSEENKNASIFNKIIRIFGEMKIYPFIYWGPHLLVVAKKN